MASIRINDHTMSLGFAYNRKTGTLSITQDESKPNRNSTGYQSQVCQCSLLGVDPVLLDQALAELGYVKAPPIL